MNELQKQFDALVEAIGAYNSGNKMGRAAAILRLTFVVEAALEAIKEALLDREVTCHDVREIISQAHSAGLITDESSWLKMVFDKEHISEAWDDGVADVIYENIEQEYVEAVGQLIEQLKVK